MSELIRCKSSIRAIEFSLLVFFISLVLVVVALFDLTDKCVVLPNNDYTCSKDPSVDTAYKKTIEDKFLAGSIMFLIALFIAVVATLNALRFSCYKTALAGSFLSLLMLI